MLHFCVCLNNLNREPFFLRLICQKHVIWVLRAVRPGRSLSCSEVTVVKVCQSRTANQRLALFLSDSEPKWGLSKKQPPEQQVQLNHEELPSSTL